jgi:hypothetical protein
MTERKLVCRASFQARSGWPRSSQMQISAPSRVTRAVKRASLPTCSRRSRSNAAPSAMPTAGAAMVPSALTRRMLKTYTRVEKRNAPADRPII